MAYYVHLSITYNSDSDDISKISDLAEKHIADLTLKQYIDEDGFDPQYVFHYLKAVKKKKNYNAGGKGELFTWGIVGNHIRVEDFVNTLKHFFKEMLQREIGISNYNRIVVFQEQENAPNATAYEIYLDEDDGEQLHIEEHKLPFKWGQG